MQVYSDWRSERVHQGIRRPEYSNRLKWFSFFKWDFELEQWRSNAGIQSLTNASLMGPQGTTGDTVNESTNGTTSGTSDVAMEEASVSTDTVLRRWDCRLIINSKEQLKKIMADHLNTSLEYLCIYWWAIFVMVHLVIHFNVFTCG